jgi:hypothetical protein
MQHTQKCNLVCTTELLPVNTKHAKNRPANKTIPDSMFWIIKTNGWLALNSWEGLGILRSIMTAAGKQGKSLFKCCTTVQGWQFICMQ